MLGLDVLVKTPLQLVYLVIRAEYALKDEGRLILVDVEMLLQIASTRKALVAEVTHVWSFTSVYSDMSLHVAHLTKLLSTSRFRTHELF